MRPETRCSHPGCARPATEIAVVDSAWEDTATGSALMVCELHVDAYARPTRDGNDAMVRVHRGGGGDVLRARPDDHLG